MIALRPSRWKYFLLLAGCLMFVALGYLMANDPSPRRPGTHFWGWATIAFCGLCIPVFLRELLRRGPKLIISEAGIEDRTNHLGLIPWTEIASIEVKAISQQTFLSLSMHSPELWVSRLPARFRWGTPANRALGFSEINIPISGLTMKPSEVAEQVERRFQAVRTAV